MLCVKFHFQNDLQFQFIRIEYSAAFMDFLRMFSLLYRNINDIMSWHQVTCHISYMIYGWTRYGCNNFYDRVQICLQCEKSFGLNMLAISNPKRAIYAFNKDQICLQCRKWSQSHVTMIFGKISWIQNFYICKHIWSVLDLRLQAYLVLFETKIVTTFGPHNNFNCNHIWSPS